MSQSAVGQGLAHSQQGAFGADTVKLAGHA